MKIYCDTLKKSDNEIIGIAEKSRHYIPVLADIDIKIDDTGIRYEKDENIYTEKNITDCIQIYQSVLRNTVEGCTDDNLLCVLLEKPMYRIEKGGKKYIKHGLHLHFPNCFLSKKDQEEHIIPRIKKCFTELKVFENLGFEDSGLVIDKSCCKVPWLMYGSRKNENMLPYKVTRVVNSTGNILSLEDAFKYYQLFDMKENLINIKGNVKYYLPRILSIDAYGRTCQELKQGLEITTKEKLLKENEKNKKSNIKRSVTENLKIAEKLLPMLAKYRAEDYNEWITIGWVLYCIGDGCLEAYDLWIEFSSRSEEFDETRCNYEWERMVKKDFTVGTLKYYAETDNKTMYEQFKYEQSQEHIKMSLDGSHNDIAKLLFTEYGTKFVCASISNRIWYEYRDHHWKEIEEGVYLRKIISEDIVEKYISEGCKFFQKVGSTDKSEVNNYKEKIKQIQKLISNCKNATYKNSVMREACEVFYNESFKEKLDTNEYLIGFKNGIYDLKLNKFRCGKPDDYISKHMPINYVEFNENEKKVKDIEEFFEKVFPDTSVRKYFLDQASDVFVGGNYQKVVLFWTGDGNNAKSVTQTLFEKMLGDYAIKFSTTLITGKKGGIGAASPELARAGGGVRWAIFEEPDGDEQINIGLLKSLSGNDSYWARDLFEKGKGTREIQPLFKLSFICNSLPGFRGCTTDAAAWNRVKVIPFESVFVRPGEPCPESYEEQLLQKRFPMDIEFYKKIPNLLEPLAWYLLEHRKKIENQSRIEPEKVTIATRLYKKQNDIYRQFIDENIVEADATLSLIELYSAFKDWYREGFSGQNVPPRNDIEDYFSKLWDEPSKGKKWYGYKIRTMEDDIKDGTAIVLTDDDFIDYNSQE
jgi:phage/plasmid-associated DNA primase